MSKKPVYVTQPYLPPLEEFIPSLKKIWDSKVLTNGGPMHQALEQALCDFLGVEHLSLFNNGTIALMTALQALGATGEVITTPFSFIATSNALLWNNLTPVFVDIDPRTLNIDPTKIEAAVTERTSAILAVHCYGNPCDVCAIQEIADRHNLSVIYDAAHAFAVKDERGSILRHGDLSVLSFHATKIFNTFEGGAIVCNNPETKRRIDQLKNFGIVDEVTVEMAGLNGKMSEVNAAFGLVQLRYVEDVIARRAKIDDYYRNSLETIRGITVPDKPQGVMANYSYFPILIDDDYPLTRDQLYDDFKDKGIFVRRYFYPLISNYSVYRYFSSAKSDFLPIANEVSSKILCLPIYPDLVEEDLDRIVSVLKEA